MPETRGTSTRTEAAVPAVSAPALLPQTNFDRALELVLRFEGGISFDKRDPGNADGNITNRGITQRTYDKWRDEHELKHRSVAACSGEETRQIYLEKYWRAGSCDKLSGALAVAQMDACVNFGVNRATKILQNALRNLGYTEVKVDGEIGPITLGAVAKADPTQLLDAMLKQRVERYQALGRHERYAPFLQGWLNRVETLRKELEPGENPPL